MVSQNKPYFFYVKINQKTKNRKRFRLYEIDIVLFS